MAEWNDDMNAAPKDGTPVLVWCEEIDRDYYVAPPAPAKNITIAWCGTANPDYPRPGSKWVSVESHAEVYEGSEETGSWTEYEFIEVYPKRWAPLPDCNTVTPGPTEPHDVNET